ncbi:hypothetical protein INR77_15385 [Erythrobacter sp. SCSIO 43205]|nr:hypothetical protein INR77_15385 [Erythrobacter sp. SCSIO 43205]
MERIDQRAPIKVIANDLGVSETRINQHIRALKDIYEAESLADLVKAYREDKSAFEDSQEESLNDLGDLSANEPTSGTQHLSESVYSKNQVPIMALIDDPTAQDDPGELVIRDVSSMVEEAPWLRPGEPTVVPRALDGEYAVWWRLVAIVGIAFGFLAALVLTVTAAVTISEALDGRAAVPDSEAGFS